MGPFLNVFSSYDFPSQLFFMSSCRRAPFIGIVDEKTNQSELEENEAEEQCSEGDVIYENIQTCVLLDSSQDPCQSQSISPV